MSFRTKINFQDNRQHKLPTRESQDFSGTTVFGVPFSAMTTGPDPSDSGSTSSIINVVSTFSGNTGTTVFNFGDSRMDIAQGVFSALTLSNSATTQDSGDVFVGNTSQVIDGNLSYLDYTGTSFEFEVTTINEVSPGIFTGSVISDDVFFISANTLDYTGRTIWSDVQGIHKTKKLMITDGAINGYVLTSDSEGMATWEPLSGTSSGDVFISGGTFSANTLTLTNNTGGTITVNDIASTGDTPYRYNSVTPSDSAIEPRLGNNVAYRKYSVVGGGQDNSSTGVTSTISGGRENKTGGVFSSIGGGYGNNITNYGYYSTIAGGKGNNITSYYSTIGGGYNNTASGNNSSVIGGYGNTVTHNDSHIIGSNITSVSANTAHVEKLNIKTLNGTTAVTPLALDANGMVVDGSAVIGSLIWSAGTGTNSAVLKGSGGVASGTLSVSEGISTTASGDYSHAEGDGTTASGSFSHAEGLGTEASGITSHAEGINTIASGNSAHAEGATTVAGGSAAHAEGENTTANGVNAHAEGRGTTASGTYSHSEGQGTTASGDRSHAEGNDTIASGDTSHAEGWLTIAGGDGSHAGGIGFGSSNLVVASGEGSFVHFGIDFNSGNLGANGDYSVILGGLNHDIGVGSTASVIVGGSGNTINNNILRTVILGGSNIVGDANDMIYVPDLVIDGLTSTDPIATDVNGKVVAGASDRRLKQNIVELSGGLDKIKNLRGVSYEWTKESNMGDGTRYGLIAQEVKEVIPDMVRLRSKGDGMLTLNYSEIIPWLIEALKEISSDEYRNVILQTQTIAAEDNNIELNYGGTHDTANGGGLLITDGVSAGVDSFIKIDEFGKWVIGPSLSTPQLTLPKYTPENTNDVIGSGGNIVWDDTYLYIKTKNGWKRTNLETF